MIFQTGLFLHMTGIILIAGGSIGSIITESLFWKNVQQDLQKAKGIAPLLLKFPLVIVRGALLMLISGILMLYSVNRAFWGQTWFTIKILLFISLVLNGRLSGRPTFIKIVQEVQATELRTGKLGELKNKIRRFHFIQFTMLFMLIALAIFKP
ncbi:MAG: DUF2269 family protein [Bacteroidota bacterium]|nr:DUF2269 family protein [Bacteroidota bacterium]